MEDKEGVSQLLMLLDTISEDVDSELWLPLDEYDEEVDELLELLELLLVEVVETGSSTCSNLMDVIALSSDPQTRV